MMPENLVVVRHGESVGNLAKRMSENGDHSLIERLRGSHTAHWPLTKKGIKQAKMTGVFINDYFTNDKKIFFDRQYVSSYARALETAGCIDLIRSNWIVDTRITERDWGDLDRMTETERNEKFGEVIAMREVEPFFWAPPNGETMNDVTIRNRDFIDSLHRAEKANIIAVCHGEIAKNLRMILFGYTPMEYAEMEFSKDSTRRIHNCQIDHYTRRNPKTFELSDRLEWFRYYRPAEGDNEGSGWEHISRRRFNSYELRQMAGTLSSLFQDLDL
ncbi:MAG: phosphoglycerate mutase family protein [Candidatus Pacebacteria bacterium]|nr:phosphoglycerate mutase family protein [Candidatus Paceibacterota bacterium]